MGEIAEMMLDGTLCQMCGVYMGDAGNGYPVTCASCQDPPKRREKKPKRKERK